MTHFAASQTRPPKINAGETVSGCPPAVRHFSQTVTYFNLLIVRGFITEGVEVLRDSASTCVRSQEQSAGDEVARRPSRPGLAFLRNVSAVCHCLSVGRPARRLGLRTLFFLLPIPSQPCQTERGPEGSGAPGLVNSAQNPQIFPQLAKVDPHS